MNASATSQGVVQSHKLEALLEATDRMLESSLGSDLRATFDQVSSSAKELLRAESCAIFLVADDSPDHVVLKSSCSDKFGLSDRSGIRLRMHHEAGGGLTGFLASLGKIVQMDWEDVRRCPYLSRSPSDYLESGKSYSVLGIPLTDRKGRKLGLIKAVNKKDEHGRPDLAGFDANDEVFARIFANKVSIVLEHVRVVDAIRELPKISPELSLAQIVKLIAERAIRLLKADRGDILLWNGARRDLIYAGRGGETQEHALKLGASAPTESIVRMLWESGSDELILKDAPNHPMYAQFHEQTKSELTVRLERSGKSLGILNVESFQSSAFDERDAQTLRLFADNATAVIDYALARTSFHAVATNKTPIRTPDEGVLSGILESVMAPLRLEAGLVMIADSDSRTLRVAAHVDVESIVTDCRGFAQPFDSPARTAWIFNHKQADFGDDGVSDACLHGKDAANFKIEGRWLGVPMMDGTRVVGVMVFYDRKRLVLKHIHLSYLQPLARLVAAYLVKCDTPAQEALRKSAGSALGGVLKSIDGNPLDTWHLRLIVLGLLAGQFERARVFKFDRQQNKQVCVAAFGHETGDCHAGDAFPIEGNDYAKHLFETFFFDRNARIYSSLDFGPDPLGQKLQKPDGLPWTQMPLVVGGDLIGHVAADNAIDHRPMSSDDVENLNCAGQLVSQLSDYAAQEARNEQYRSLLDNLPVTAWEKDLDGRFTFASKHFAHLMSCSPGDIEGKTDQDFFPPILCEMYLEGDREVVRTGKIIRRENELFEPASGERIHVDVVKGPVYDASARIAGTQGMWWDATRRVRKLERIQRQLERAQEMASIGSWEWDVAKNRVIPSDGIYKIFGFDRVNRNASLSAFFRAVAEKEHFLALMARIAPDRLDAFVEKVGLPSEMADRAKSVAGERHPMLATSASEGDIETQISRPDGEKRVIYAKYQLNRDVQGTLDRVVVMAQDVTEIRKAERVLFEEEKREHWRRVAYEIAHQIKSPLAAQAIFLRELGKGIEKHPELSDLRGILDKAHAARSTSEELMVRVMELAEHKEPVLTRCDLKACAEEAWANLRSAERTAEAVDFHLEAEGLVVAEADHGLVLGILDVLLRNALIYGKPEQAEMQRICCQIAEYPASGLGPFPSFGGPYIAVIISDNGPGVPEAIVRTLEQPFKPQAKGKGAGLGLALACKKASAMGGSIRCVSDGARGAGGASIAISMKLLQEHT